MKQLKLFDYEEVELSPLRFYSKYQTWKWKHKYKKAKEKSNIRCKNCKYMIQRQLSKSYYKCRLLGESSSPSTDVRLSCVCDLFEEGN